MGEKKRVFLYPITKEIIREESNSYIRHLNEQLGAEFEVVNYITKYGLLDAVAKFHKTNIYYFNWIEEVSTKKYGLLQFLILPFLLVGSKLTGKKIVWFIHNNVSHYKDHLLIKKIIIRLMTIFADVIFAHSSGLKLKVPKKKLHIFHHPIEPYRPLLPPADFTYDLLIWGSVSSYKGIYEFVSHVSQSPVLRNYKILVAGAFSSEAYYESVMQIKTDNVTVLKKLLSTEELIDCISMSKYILFTYVSKSILASAALCKTLSFGKEVIGPDIGAFKELGAAKLLYTYRSFKELDQLLTSLGENNGSEINQTDLQAYINKTSWEAFSEFLSLRIKRLFVVKDYPAVSNLEVRSK